MSRKPVSVSRVLDALQAWGTEPVVAPVKLVDGKLPEVPATRFDSWGWAVGYFLATFVICWAVTIAYFWAANGGAHFIYAEF